MLQPEVQLNFQNWAKILSKIQIWPLMGKDEICWGCYKRAQGPKAIPSTSDINSRGSDLSLVTASACSCVLLDTLINL